MLEKKPQSFLRSLPWRELIDVYFPRLKSLPDREVLNAHKKKDLVKICGKYQTPEKTIIDTTKIPWEIHRAANERGFNLHECAKSGYVGKETFESFCKLHRITNAIKKIESMTFEISCDALDILLAGISDHYTSCLSPWYGGLAHNQYHYYLHLATYLKTANVGIIIVRDKDRGYLVRSLFGLSRNKMYCQYPGYGPFHHDWPKLVSFPKEIVLVNTGGFFIPKLASSLRFRVRDVL